MTAKWRKRLKWTFYVTSLGVIVGFGIYYVRTALLPYSLKYNHNAQPLSTTPNGVGEEAKAHTDGASSVVTPKVVLMTPVKTEAKALDAYTDGIEFRVSILDERRKPIHQGLRDVTVTLSSSSSTGQFDTGTAIVFNETTPDMVVRYFDTTAGNPKLSAFVSELVGGTLAVTVQPNEPTKLGPITPTLRTPIFDAGQVYAVTLQDRFGNAVGGADVNWSVVSDQPTEPYTYTQAITADDQGTSRFTLELPAERVNIPEILSATFAASSVNLRVIPTQR